MTKARKQDLKLIYEWADLPSAILGTQINHTHGYFGSLGIVFIRGFVFGRRWSVKDAQEEHPSLFELMTGSPTNCVDSDQIFLKNFLLLKVLQWKLRRNSPGVENAVYREDKGTKFKGLMGIINNQAFNMMKESEKAYTEMIKKTSDQPNQLVSNHTSK